MTIDKTTITNLEFKRILLLFYVFPATEQKMTIKKDLEDVPKAASSRELPWPITAVSMRLINGPQIQSPVAGPVNFIISFIWFHILWSANPSVFTSTAFSSSFSSDKETEVLLMSFSLANSWLELMQVVINLFRWSFGAKTHSLEGTRELCHWRVVEMRNVLLQEVKDWESSFSLEFGEETKWLAKVLTCIFFRKLKREWIKKDKKRNLS